MPENGTCPKKCNNRIDPQNKLAIKYPGNSNTEAGASLPQRVSLSKVLTPEDAQLYSNEKILVDGNNDNRHFVNI
jgi:hypothetical protein